MYAWDVTYLIDRDEKIDGGYYGATYPLKGKYYSASGELIYDGLFKVVHRGGVGYPKVLIPEGDRLEDETDDFTNGFAYEERR